MEENEKLFLVHCLEALKLFMRDRMTAELLVEYIQVMAEKLDVR